MTSENIDNSSRESVVRWGTTKFGDDHTTYDEIEKDPYLRERIEPKDGFKVVIDDFKYTVKFYDAGKISVFKKKKQAGYKIDTETQNRTNHRIQEISHIGHSNRSNTLSGLDLMNTFIKKENRKILGFKKVILEEFSSEDQWEIFYHFPIVVLEDKPYLILIKRGDNAKYSQGSEDIERKTDESNDGLMYKEASNETDSTLEK